MGKTTVEPFLEGGLFSSRNSFSISCLKITVNSQKLGKALVATFVNSFDILDHSASVLKPASSSHGESMDPGSRRCRVV